MIENQQFAEKRFVYGRVFRALHWAVAACFIIAVILIFSRNLIDDPGLYKDFIGLHRSFGMGVLLLALWRLFTREFPYTGNSPMLQFVASISHSAIYLCLLATPFLGWMEASARHKPVMIFGLKLPMLIDRNLELAEELQIWHVQLATVFCAVIAIHVLSALWHHFFRRDGVLYSMIPIPMLRRPWAERFNKNHTDKSNAND
jgi:cytochrome b561